ncbi:hypothetical protein GOBAR_AA04748 [Gossypium barbadense]|uniref:Receptor-like serine/threonine-protein kinase n=1 Tax=Gossypium barbadense TaxID=3634 RepID=A0A2P5YJR7_GOSBA|nr:hypothetical protein GOBAR_AA04748 [Gossypium barbadense]
MDHVKWLISVLLLLFLTHLSISTDTITLDHFIKDNQVIVSSGKIFALGFFSPGSSRNRYVGIWYHQIPEKTVVWVANRESPIKDNSGILRIDSQGNLALFQRNQTLPVWSTNVSITGTRNSIALILDSGNLVLLQNDTRRAVLWESFDYPTNSMLPFMKLGWSFRTGVDRVLTSWKSPDDPGIGNYSYRINPSGFPQLYLYKGSAPWWRTGSWTGQRWSGVPEMTSSYIFNVSFVNTPDEVSITYGVKKASFITRMITNETGIQQRFTWNNQARHWIGFWSAPKDQCDFYGHCGPNGYCNPDHPDDFECTCFPGFKPKSSEAWFIRDGAGGCVRKPGISTCQKGEGFVKVPRLKVPDTSAAHIDMSMGLKQCENECLRNCSCVAYASAYAEINGGIGCLTWHGDLIDARTYADAGQDLYIRVDASELVTIVSAAVLFLILVALLRCLVRRLRRAERRRKSKNAFSFTSSSLFEDSVGEKDIDESRRNGDLPFFDFSTIAKATNNFSSDNKLGQGGFGAVYKGVLINGKEIAVKRLSKYSGQGVEEFKNEIVLIAKLQHRNLDSRLRIIHRDLKASNVLLDAAMNPKISDFGMARIFGRDEIEGDTKRVVGTYGYMSPEYAMHGHFSIKSDVYSFGVLLLEIITGKKNSSYFPDSPSSSLVGYVWELWKEDRAIEIIDSVFGDSYSANEFLKCIQIGLLCVQEHATDRPMMSTVVFMLSNETALPSPKQPAFTVKTSHKGDEILNSEQTESTNDVTLSMVQAR